MGKERIQSVDDKARSSAFKLAETFVDWQDEELQKMCLRSLADRSPHVRATTVMFLATKSELSTELIAGLLRKLTDIDVLVRCAAVVAVGSVASSDNDAAVLALKKRLKDKVPDIRRHAIVALKQLKVERRPDVLAALISRLYDKKDKVAHEAARCIDARVLEDDYDDDSSSSSSEASEPAKDAGKKKGPTIENHRINLLPAFSKACKSLFYVCPDALNQVQAAVEQGLDISQETVQKGLIEPQNLPEFYTLVAVDMRGADLPPSLWATPLVRYTHSEAGRAFLKARSFFQAITACQVLDDQKKLIHLHDTMRPSELKILLKARLEQEEEEEDQMWEESEEEDIELQDARVEAHLRKVEWEAELLEAQLDAEALRKAKHDKKVQRELQQIEDGAVRPKKWSEKWERGGKGKGKGSHNDFKSDWSALFASRLGKGKGGKGKEKEEKKKSLKERVQERKMSLYGDKENYEQGGEDASKFPPEPPPEPEVPLTGHYVHIPGVGYAYESEPGCVIYPGEPGYPGDKEAAKHGLVDVEEEDEEEDDDEDSDEEGAKKKKQKKDNAAEKARRAAVYLNEGGENDEDPDEEIPADEGPRPTENAFCTITGRAIDDIEDVD